MATKVRVKLDKPGIGEVLKSSDMATMVRDAGERIADNARSNLDRLPVTVHDYTTDRAGTAVTIASDYGLGVQAREGTLTKAAGSIGAEVTEQ